jgi:hypothetical protein
MQALAPWRDALGILSVVLAILAALIYILQTLRGEVRPHPLSWFLFGILSLTGYWVQRDEGVRQGSWTLLAMTIICFLFVAASVARGEWSFSRTEWAFAVAGGAVRPLPLRQRGQCRRRFDDGRRRARLWSDVYARLVFSEKGQRRRFCAQRGKVCSLSDGHGSDLVRHELLPGHAYGPERGGLDHAHHAQARRSAVAPRVIRVRPVGGSGSDRKGACAMTADRVSLLVRRVPAGSSHAPE